MTLNHPLKQVFMKSTNKLTELQIKQAKPQTKQYKLTDGAGLFLLVHENGSKYWRFNYRIDGKQKTQAFGVYPETSLTEARQKKSVSRSLIKDGFDPIQNKREKKRIRPNDSSLTIPLICFTFHFAHLVQISFKTKRKNAQIHRI